MYRRISDRMVTPLMRGLQEEAQKGVQAAQAETAVTRGWWGLFDSANREAMCNKLYVGMSTHS